MPKNDPRPLAYLAGYPAELQAQVRQALDDGTLATRLRARYPQGHAVQSERALWDHVQELKARHLRSAPPLAKVTWEPRLEQVRQALGTHTRVSRVQGGRLKAKREIRIATVFKEAPADFLRMIVVHELAHLKEGEHDKAFYALCCHMATDYHQLEFDTRLWLTLRAADASAAPAPGIDAVGASPKT